jgi:hypothetical protein
MTYSSLGAKLSLSGISSKKEKTAGRVDGIFIDL